MRSQRPVNSFFCLTLVFLWQVSRGNKFPEQDAFSTSGELLLLAASCLLSATLKDRSQQDAVCKKRELS
jgi:hypothetical protein